MSATKATLGFDKNGNLIKNNEVTKLLYDAMNNGFQAQLTKTGSKSLKLKRYSKGEQVTLECVQENVIIKPKNGAPKIVSYDKLDLYTDTLTTDGKRMDENEDEPEKGKAVGTDAKTTTVK